MSMLSTYLKEREDTYKNITKMADFLEKAFESYERKESKKVVKKTCRYGYESNRFGDCRIYRV